MLRFLCLTLLFALFLDSPAQAPQVQFTVTFKGTVNIPNRPQNFNVNRIHRVYVEAGVTRIIYEQEDYKYIIINVLEPIDTVLRRVNDTGCPILLDCVVRKYNNVIKQQRYLLGLEYLVEVYDRPPGAPAGSNCAITLLETNSVVNRLLINLTVDSVLAASNYDCPGVGPNNVVIRDSLYDEANWLYWETDEFDGVLTVIDSFPLGIILNDTTIVIGGDTIYLTGGSVRDYVDIVSFIPYSGWVDFTGVGAAWDDSVELYRLYDENPVGQDNNVIETEAHNSVAIGDSNRISSSGVGVVDNLYIFGYRNHLSLGPGSRNHIMFGSNNSFTSPSVNLSRSTIIGHNNTGGGIGGTVVGTDNTNGSFEGFVFGDGNYNGTAQSYLIGRNNSTVTIWNPTYAFGTGNRPDSRNGMALGSFLITNAYYEVALGAFNLRDDMADSLVFVDGNAIFTVGNGRSVGARSDAFSVLNTANTGINIDIFRTDNAGQMLQVNGSMQVRAVDTLGIGVDTVSTDQFRIIKTFSAAANADTVYLPDLSDPTYNGTEFHFKEYTGNTTNDWHIATVGADLIEGAATYLMDTEGKSVILYWFNDQWFVE